MGDNYIFLLPEELIIKTLSHLKTYDVFQFFIAYPSLANILYGCKLIRSLDFNLEYRLNQQRLREIIKFDLTNVDSLSIVEVNWIPAEDLKACIGKCKNLTQLCAICTKFEGDEDNYLFIRENCPKLEFLSITVSYDQYCKGIKNYLPKIEEIYIHIKFKSLMETRGVIPPEYVHYQDNTIIKFM